MKKIDFSYGLGTLCAEIDERNLLAVIEPLKPPGSHEAAPASIVRRALNNPCGSPLLRELARNKRRVTVITSDHTRAVPSQELLPPMLTEIRQGNPDAEITILIGTGLHRATTQAEQREMFGDFIVDNERIVVNNAFCPADFVDFGILPSGAHLQINRVAAECDLLVSIGLIEPHFFAGFSGGRKSVLPAICSEATVNENHSFAAIASPFAANGVLENNPIHIDMLAAARMAKLAFILNTVVNEQKQLIAAFAGEMELAHLEGAQFLRNRFECRKQTGDIVITSNGGYPLDQNLYQTPKAASTAAICAGENGVIILLAECRDGFGGENFKTLIRSGSPEQIAERLSHIPPKETISEQWCAQIYSGILKKHPLILVSSLPESEVRAANMIPAASPADALSLARQIVGQGARVVAIPDGVSTMIVR